jgi:hypothetical protein
MHPITGTYTRRWRHDGERLHALHARQRQYLREAEACLRKLADWRLRADALHQAGHLVTLLGDIGGRRARKLREALIALKG